MKIQDNNNKHIELENLGAVHTHTHTHTHTGNLSQKLVFLILALFGIDKIYKLRIEEAY